MVETGKTLKITVATGKTGRWSAQCSP